MLHEYDDDDDECFINIILHKISSLKIMTIFVGAFFISRMRRIVSRCVFVCSVFAKARLGYLLFQV